MGQRSTGSRSGKKRRKRARSPRVVVGQHRRCLNVGSDGSSICRVSPRPQAKATKSKREEPESAGAFREFIEGAGPTDKVEQGGVVIRSNGVVDSAATINGAKEVGEAMLDTFGEKAVLALKGRHGCDYSRR